MRDAREASDVSRNRKRALRKSKDYAEIWLLIELRINCSSQGPCRSLHISSLLPIFICSFPILRNPRQLGNLNVTFAITVPFHSTRSQTLCTDAGYQRFSWRAVKFVGVGRRATRHGVFGSEAVHYKNGV